MSGDMARPGLTKHRKFRRLARLLGSDVLALGHLEWLWSVAYEDGNDYLGDSEDVESAAKWSGQPGELTQALLTCGGHGHAGFIEPAPDHPEGHYRIHELWDHAPRYVKRRAAREQERKDAGRPMDGHGTPTGRPVDVTPSTRTQHPAPKIKPMSADADPPPAETDGFDAFWAAYPKHTAKQDAVKAWRKLKPSPALQGIILAAIEDQRTWRQWREGFVPHPATWLHGKRWDDERPAEDRPARASPPPGPPVVVSTETWAEARARQLAEARAARQA